MKIWVRLAPAYSPESGEPARAAPLDTITTKVPPGSGPVIAALQKLNAILTSFSQFAENCCPRGKLRDAIGRPEIGC